MGLGKTYSTKYLVDSNNNTGAVGEVLVSTATGINWANGSDIVGGPYLPLAGGTMTGTITMDSANIDIKSSLGVVGTILSSSNSLTLNARYTGDMIFQSGGAEKMRIANGGNVGIGTTSPGAKLQITAANASSPTANIFLDIDGNNQPGMGGQIIFGTSASGTLTNYNARIQGVRSSLDDGSSDIHFQTTHVATATAPTTKMTILSGGNVGIGTDSPNSKLTVFNAEADTSINVNTGTGGSYPKKTGISFGATSTSLGGDAEFTGGAGIQAINTAASGNPTDLTFWTNSTGTPAERMRITSTGNVGIGVTGPGEKLEVGGNIQAFGATFQGTTGSVIALKSSGAILRANIKGNNNGLELGVIGTNSINFEWDGVTKIQMKSTGRLGIGTGTAGPDSLLEIEGATNSSTSNLLRLSRASQGSAPEKVAGFYSGTSGEKGYITVNNFGTAYNTSSDYRLKENIKPIEDSVERLMSLKPCSFNFISEEEDKIVMDGFIAHEAKDVVPEAVTGIKDAVDEKGNPMYQGIDQSKIVPLLTAALQQALQRIEILEQKINN